VKKDINVGVDIGGTKINIGLINETGEIIDRKKMAVERELHPDVIIGLISQEINLLIEKNSLIIRDINSIGVGVPGTVDIKTGFVEYCPNLGWEDVPASSIFQNFIKKEVYVAQDSRLAAWAEYLFGVGKKYSSILCVTLGTGIGCGIIVDGKIFNGAMNTAGELGHMVFQKNGTQCICGNRGCLERYCSGTAIIERALQRFPQKLHHLPPISESVFELAYAGDKEGLDLINEVVEDLAIGIANAVSLISPEAVILSGGLCEHEELIIKPLKELVHRFGYYSWVRKHQLKVEKALMGSDAPMIGAAFLFKAIEK